MKYDDAIISSVADLLAKLSEQVQGNEPVWYRGQANKEWSLSCSLERFGGLEKEPPLIKRFKQNALPLMVVRPESEWEWLFVMQHHGLPTRLLDWTESALVALYFAINGSGTDHDDVDGCVWGVLPLALNRIAIPDDETTDIPGLGDDPHLDSYLPSLIGAQRQPLKPLAAIALRNNSRIQMQQGVFTVFHKGLEPLDADDGNEYLWKLVIPAASKVRIRRELELLNVSKLSLFPDLSNVSEHAKGLAQWQNLK